MTMIHPELTWNPEKNRILRETRGVSFEDVEDAIEAGNLLTDIPHPLTETYPNQRILVVLIRGYTFNVPYVVDDGRYFLKTMYASRKAMKIFSNRGNDDESKN